MFGVPFPELVGYLASALVVLSLTMSSVLRLRLLNLAGAVVFLIYGVLIDAPPIILTNVVIVGINVWFLVKVLTDREFFTVLEVRPDSYYLGEFLRFHADDIHRYQPSFREVPPADCVSVFILRDAVPAGVFVGVPHGEGTLRVLLDYVLPRYRDFKVGRWLYGPGSSFFTDRGIHRLVAEGGSRTHERYLRRMGYRREGDRYVLELGESSHRPGIMAP